MSDKILFCQYKKIIILKDDYHFFACINYINQVKTGPFAEHSNQLWNVSGVQSWNKVYLGKDLSRIWTENSKLTIILDGRTYIITDFSIDPYYFE